MKMNKKILVSVFFIGLLALGVGWGTYALFSDTETSSDNTFTAGTLDLKVDGQDDTSLPIYFDFGNVQPSDSGSKVIALSNTGTLDGTAKIHIKDVTNTEGTNPEPETDITEPGDLGAALLITIQYDANGDSNYDAGETIVTDASIDSLNSVTNVLGLLGAGASRNLKLSWNVDGAAGNDIMGDVVTFNIEFILEQA
jgi:spore coat-associated protein N